MTGQSRQPGTPLELPQFSALSSLSGGTRLLILQHFPGGGRSRFVLRQLRTSLPKGLANSAVNLKGCLIEVMGYANSTGNADMNQRLGMDLAGSCGLLDPKLQRPGETHPGARGQTTRFHRDVPASTRPCQGSREPRIGPAGCYDVNAANAVPIAHCS